MRCNRRDCYISTAYCGTPTLANDVCLASNCPYELQAILAIQENYACKENYSISETKLVVVKIGETDYFKFTLNVTGIPHYSNATHLGINRDSMSKFGSSTIIQERIATAKRATYAMMGVGLH